MILSSKSSRNVNSHILIEIVCCESLVFGLDEKTAAGNILLLLSSWTSCWKTLNVIKYGDLSVFDIVR